MLFVSLCGGIRIGLRIVVAFALVFVFVLVWFVLALVLVALHDRGRVSSADRFWVIDRFRVDSVCQCLGFFTG